MPSVCLQRPFVPGSGKMAVLLHLSHWIQRTGPCANQKPQALGVGRVWGEQNTRVPEADRKGSVWGGPGGIRDPGRPSENVEEEAEGRRWARRLCLSGVGPAKRGDPETRRRSQGRPLHLLFPVGRASPLTARSPAICLHLSPPRHTPLSPPSNVAMPRCPVRLFSTALITT